MTSPFDPLNTALATNQNADWIAIGDSTDYGMIDANWFTEYGWPGRVGIALGAHYNVNVVLKVFQIWTGNGTNNTTGGAFGPATYAAPVGLYSSSNPGAATLTVWLGGWPGGVMANYVSDAAQMLPISNPLLITVYSGYNEQSISAYTSGMSTFLTDAQALCPGAPIVVCDQHQTTATYEQNHFILFSQLFAALLGELLPGATPGTMSPPLQASTTTSGVWVLDTQQQLMTAADLYTDGLHPNSTGHALLASWIYNNMLPAPSSPIVFTISPTLTGHGSLTANTEPPYPGAASLPCKLPFILGQQGAVLFGHGALTATTYVLPRVTPGESPILAWTLPIQLGKTSLLSGKGTLSATAVLLPYPAILPWYLPIQLPPPVKLPIPGHGATTIAPLTVIPPPGQLTGRGVLSARAYNPAATSPRTIALPPDNRIIGAAIDNRTPVVGPDARFEDVPRIRTP